MRLSEIVPVLLLHSLLFEQFFLVAVEGMFHSTLDVDVFQPPVRVDLIRLKELRVVPREVLI